MNKQTIKKSELRTLIKEHLSAFYLDATPFATIGAGSLSDTLNSEKIDMNEEELQNAIAETVSQLERNAKIRMQAEAAGVGRKNILNKSMVTKNISKMIREELKLRSLKSVSVTNNKIDFTFGTAEEGNTFANYLKEEKRLHGIEGVSKERVVVSMVCD